MKAIFFAIVLLVSFRMSAQLPSISIAPDFIFFDINGKQHHLHSYLNQGKIVILYFSPAWCQECFTYHRTNALKDFYSLYGPLGTNQVRVLFIETDPAMERSDLMGITSATAGDWITDTPYPIIDTSEANERFKAITTLPTVYGIYPNQFLFNLGRRTTDELLEFLNGYTLSTNIPDTMIKITMNEVKSPSCNGFEDGLIRLSVTGPGISYRYRWNTGDTVPLIENLPRGTYRCTVTDNLGNLHITDPINLEDPDNLTLTFLKNTPTSTTANNGSLIANVSGGTPPYSFIWSTGSDRDRLQNIGPGTYSCQVFDANGCQISLTEELKVPDCSIQVLFNIEPTSCDENPDGAINIQVAGATAPVIYVWNTGATTQSLINIPSGGYELTVTDALGCSRIIGAKVTIDDDVRPVIRVRKEPIRVYLDEDGTFNLSAEMVDSGSFDNCAILGLQMEQELFTCQDLGRRFIQFTAIDKNLNLSSEDIEILVLDTIKPKFPCPENVNIAACDGIVNYQVPVALDNCGNGSLTLFQGIGSGNVFPLGTSTERYTYVAGDGTRLTCNINVTVEKRISASVNTRDVTCPGSKNGSATVVLQETTKPYTFRWSDGQTTQSAVNLGPGNYSVTVSEASECTFVENFSLGEPALLFIRLDSIKAPDDLGDIFVTVLGGTPPYRFQWTNINGNIVSTIQDPFNLPFGTYVLRVLDDNNCASTISIKVDLTTSTDEPEIFRDLILSPNPASSAFEIVFKSSVLPELELEIYRPDGVQIHQARYNLGSPARLKIELDQPPGMYLVHLRTVEGFTTRPLLILK